MKAVITINSTAFEVDFSNPIDLSIPLGSGSENPLAWTHDTPVITPVTVGDWVGKVSEGASINFNEVFISPHAHGTHTESYGHISETFYSVNQALKAFMFDAVLITVSPASKGEDWVIQKSALEQLLLEKTPEAVIIRTLPNDASKKHKCWTDTNWPYLAGDAAQFLREIGVQHLLIDLPSVDKERDEGMLAAHKAFWNYPEKPEAHRTITEMIYVPDDIPDGRYLLNLQITSLENDASPSKPVIYKLRGL